MVANCPVEISDDILGRDIGVGCSALALRAALVQCPDELHARVGRGLHLAASRRGALKNPEGE